jgi:hypothetical protein
MLSGDGVISQRIGLEAWPSSLRPATAGAHLPMGEGQRDPMGVPKLHI